MEMRARRTFRLAQLGEASAGRQALEGASVAPGTNATFRALRDPDRRPKLPREPVPDEIASFEPVEKFSLEEGWFRSNVRKARWRAAAGPSGMNADHLRLMLENSADFPALSQMAPLLCKAKVADEILSVMVKAESLRWRGPTEESEVLREKPVGSAYNFGNSEERIARRRTVVRMHPRFTSSARIKWLSKSTVSSRTPRGKTKVWNKERCGA